MKFTKSSITFDHVEEIAVTINEATDPDVSASICSICFNISEAQLDGESW